MSYTLSFPQINLAQGDGTLKNIFCVLCISNWIKTILNTGQMFEIIWLPYHNWITDIHKIESNDTKMFIIYIRILKIKASLLFQWQWQQNCVFGV